MNNSWAQTAPVCAGKIIAGKCFTVGTDTTQNVILIDNKPFNPPNFNPMCIGCYKSKSGMGTCLAKDYNSQCMSRLVTSSDEGQWYSNAQCASTDNLETFGGMQNLLYGITSGISSGKCSYIISKNDLSWPRVSCQGLEILGKCFEGKSDANKAWLQINKDIFETKEPNKCVLCLTAIKSNGDDVVNCISTNIDETFCQKAEFTENTFTPWSTVACAELQTLRAEYTNRLAKYKSGDKLTWVNTCFSPQCTGLAVAVSNRCVTSDAKKLGFIVDSQTYIPDNFDRDCLGCYKQGLDDGFCVARSINGQDCRIFSYSGGKWAFNKADCNSPDVQDKFKKICVAS
ncbi:MAG: hypothetical protein KBD64_05050 [Gammaproteobacteria bacterium]|nr:hypothetical protein [Gammaproteobacteria bacterium]